MHRTIIPSVVTCDSITSKVGDKSSTQLGRETYPFHSALNSAIYDSIRSIEGRFVLEVLQPWRKFCFAGGILIVIKILGDWLMLQFHTWLYCCSKSVIDFIKFWPLLGGIWFVKNKIWYFTHRFFMCQQIQCEGNSLWPSDIIWRHKSGSTLAHVMACCLTAPSHYLNQCRLTISKVQWHPSESNFIRDTSAIRHWNSLEYYLSKFCSNLPGDN